MFWSSKVYLLSIKAVINNNLTGNVVILLPGRHPILRHLDITICIVGTSILQTSIHRKLIQHDSLDLHSHRPVPKLD